MANTKWLGFALPLLISFGAQAAAAQVSEGTVIRSPLTTSVEDEIAARPTGARGAIDLVGVRRASEEGLRRTAEIQAEQMRLLALARAQAAAPASTPDTPAAEKLAPPTFDIEAAVASDMARKRAERKFGDGVAKGVGVLVFLTLLGVGLRLWKGREIRSKSDASVDKASDSKSNSGAPY